MTIEKNLYKMTEQERLKYLEKIAVQLIKGESIPSDAAEWLGRGILDLSIGRSFNDAFRVKRIKKSDPQKHAVRYALVEQRRANGMSRENAIAEVATMLGFSEETIDESWGIQSKKQKTFQLQIDALKETKKTHNF